MPAIALDDCDLHYRDQGAGEAVLLIHGLGASCADWEGIAPRLARRFRVISPCLRGFGHSGRPAAGYDVPGFAADLLALLERLDIRRVHVLGHSLGGAVAYQLVLQAPQRVASLCIVNSLPSFATDTWAKRLLYYERLLLLRLFGLSLVARRGASRAFPHPDQAELRARSLERQRGNLSRVYLAVMRGLKGWSVAERLGEIRCPVLVLAAEYDLTPVSEKQRYAEALPDARLVVIPNSRHATHLDRPVEFLQEVEEFLRLSSATSAGRAPEVESGAVDADDQQVARRV